MGFALVLLTVMAGAVHAQAPLPDDFNPQIRSEFGNPGVYSLAVQPDGRILVGGGFSTVTGQPRNNVARLNADGTLDSGFNPGPNASVFSLVMQADGKILVGGAFMSLGAQYRNFIARLNADGTLESGFNPGANGTVRSLAMQPDGRILVGGMFTTLGSQTRYRIARLNADGTLDSGFNPGAAGSSTSVESLAVQADGKILVGGYFTTLGGQSRTNIARLNADGTLDSGFNLGANGGVLSLVVQADGKILVGGTFTTLGGQARNRIARLNADGTVDSQFNPGASGTVSSLMLQADGKTLVGGAFTTLGGQTRYGIARLNADGTLDSGFNPGAAGTSVQSLAVQADGKILVGGLLRTLGGQSRWFSRLNNTEPATQSLSFDGSTTTWLRGGTSPEVWRTTFEHPTSGVTWNSMGEGTRIPSGWQLTGIAVPEGASIRARGHTTGGQYNASGRFLESFLLHWDMPCALEPARLCASSVSAAPCGR